MSAEQTGAPPPVRVSLRAKLSAMAVLLVVVPLAVVGILLVDINAETVKENNRELQIAVGQDVQSTVDASFAQAEDGLETVARALVRGDLSEELRLSLLRSSVEGAEALDHVAIYDAKGELIDVLREQEAEALPAPESIPSDLRKAADRDGRSSGGSVPSEAGPRTLVTVPVRADGRVTGYIASYVSLEQVQARVELLVASHFDGEADALFVVDREGHVLAHGQRGRADTLPSFADRPILRALGDRLDSAEFSRSGEFDAEDGTVWVGTVVGLESRPWSVIIQQPRSEVYESLDRMRRTVGWTVAGAIATALLAGLGLARRVVAPLRQLTEFTVRLARREFDQRVEVGTGDELALVGHALNAAAVDLAESERKLADEAAIRRDLSRYVDGELVDKIVAREQDMHLGGRRRMVTILFADVVAFTPLTEKLGPEQVVGLLNELFTIATEIVFRNGGLVDKFVGDSIMATWGALDDEADHAIRALSAAEELRSWLELGNESWRERYGVELELAVGVNTGEVIVGNVGSETRMEYTSIGDVVNVAARLEAIARPNQILLTGGTRAMAAGEFSFGHVGPRELSGRSEPVDLWELRE